MSVVRHVACAGLLVLAAGVVGCSSGGRSSSKAGTTPTSAASATTAASGSGGTSGSGAASATSAASAATTATTRAGTADPCRLATPAEVAHASGLGITTSRSSLATCFYESNDHSGSVQVVTFSASDYDSRVADETSSGLGQGAVQGVGTAAYEGAAQLYVKADAQHAFSVAIFNVGDHQAAELAVARLVVSRVTQ